MTVVINGDTGITDVDGTAAAPALTGTDTNSGVFFSTDIVGLATSGSERLRATSDGRIQINGSNSLATTLVATANAVTLANAATVYQFRASATPNAANTNAVGFGVTYDLPATGAFTNHYGVYNDTLATGGATLTNNFGFYASSQTVGTNAYGFFSNLSSAADRWGFYGNGTAASYFAGDVRTDDGFLHTTSVNSSNTSVTLTTTSTLTGGIRTGTPAANINYTLPTGTSCDAQFTSLQTSMGAEWTIVNLAAATYSITVLANTDHTVVGNMVVAANTSARFLSRKTGTNTFVTYRIA